MQVLIAERSTGQVRVYAADFSVADNLLEDAARNADPSALTPELAYLDAAAPATPAGASKELFMESANVAGMCFSLQRHFILCPSCRALREQNT